MPRINTHVTVDYPPDETAIWSGNNVGGNVHLTTNKDTEVVSVIATVQSLVKTKVRDSQNNARRQAIVLYQHSSSNLVEGSSFTVLKGSPRQFRFSLPTRLDLPSTVNFERQGRALIEHVVQVDVISVKGTLLGGRKQVQSRAVYAFYLRKTFVHPFPPPIVSARMQRAVRAGSVIKRTDLGTWSITLTRPTVMVACEANSIGVTVDMTQASSETAVDRVKCCAAVTAKVVAVADGNVHETEWLVAGVDFPPLHWDLASKTLSGQAALRMDGSGFDITRKHRQALGCPSTQYKASDSMRCSTLSVTYELVVGVTYAGVVRAKSQHDVEVWLHKQSGIYIPPTGRQAVPPNTSPQMLPMPVPLHHPVQANSSAHQHPPAFADIADDSVLPSYEASMVGRSTGALGSLTEPRQRSSSPPLRNMAANWTPSTPSAPPDTSHPPLYPASPVTSPSPSFSSYPSSSILNAQSAPITERSSR
eukprot:m.92492 g.92492  ORF g.92492 m.92492 type:complete len:476 (+) comp14947_c0_seq4:75-1502(+)